MEKLRKTTNTLSRDSQSHGQDLNPATYLGHAYDLYAFLKQQGSYYSGSHVHNTWVISDRVKYCHYTVNTASRWKDRSCKSLQQRLPFAG